MPFYVRHRKISEKIGVFIVWADSAEEAEKKPLSANTAAYKGYWTNEPEVTHDEQIISQPYASRKEAEVSKDSWIEDI